MNEKRASRTQREVKKTLLLQFQSSFSLPVATKGRLISKAIFQGSNSSKKTNEILAKFSLAAKAEFMQENIFHTPIICLKTFIDKEVGNQKNSSQF